MLNLVTKEPQPYTLEADRESDVPTVFWVTPQTAEETQEYLNRYLRETRRGGTSASDTTRTRRAVSHDRQTLASLLTKVENAYAVGDALTAADEIGAFVEKLDYPSLNEVIRAAQNMSTLRAAAKNS